MIYISCVVPAFKRVDQTLLSLDLLLASEGVGSAYELEVILADSTPDDSLKTAVHQKFGDRVVYIKPDKLGIAGNKNAGAKIAKHPILIFCDADVEVEKNTIAESIASLQKHDRVAGVGGNVFWRGGEHNGQKDRPRLEDRMMIKEDTTFIEALYSRFFVTYKDIFWAVGGFDADVFNMRGDGSDLSVRYWRLGFPLAYEESIVVHHVHDSPDASDAGIDHPEWDVARDLLLLGYKYDMYNDGFKNFPATVNINFSSLGGQGYYRMLQGIGRHYEFIMAAKPILDAFRASEKPIYDFKFLEVFSNAEMFGLCIDAAQSRIAAARAVAFPT
jgi:glycosyltransferase involved in cell wall biosynthesis